MRVSYEWLKDYIDVDRSPAELAERRRLSAWRWRAWRIPGQGWQVCWLVRSSPWHRTRTHRWQVRQVDIGKGMVQMVRFRTWRWANWICCVAGGCCLVWKAAAGNGICGVTQGTRCSTGSWDWGTRRRTGPEL